MTDAPSYWKEAVRHLGDRDPVMKKLMAGCRSDFLRGRGDAFATLARSIVSQQISVKAAASIWKRIEEKTTITPTGILALGDEDLRSCGLSQSKVKYLRHLAEAFAAGHVGDSHWHHADDADVISSLVKLPGIGRWTAEMFLIFHLMRPDVFPVADVGLQKAVARHYPRRKLDKLGHLWQPYRTVATWYLWRSLDPEPVEY